MRIGIITFHFVPNQGAVLQCYALQEFLKKLGHDVSIIDYRPPYHTIRYEAIKNPFLYVKHDLKKYYNYSLKNRFIIAVRSFLRCTYMNIRGVDKKVEKNFNKFISHTLHLTKEYNSLQQLRDEAPVMDAYICGSDQLWNPTLLDQELDEAYFLKFGNEKIVRISYAVSTGKEPDEQTRVNLKEYCKDFSAISLREYSDSAIQAIGRDVHICIDPTLLLDKEGYKKIESEIKEHESYIFVYGFEMTDSLQQAVDAAVQKYGCKVINGSPHRVKLNSLCECKREYGPDEFLTYIKNAHCVVTNSFHGTVFSIIYQKNFVSVPHTKLNLRISELLGKLGLIDRIWSDKGVDFNKHINWYDVDEKLQIFKKQSIEYLTLALEGKKSEDMPHYQNELKSYS